EIVRRMALLGEDANSLDGILLTHEHGDHCGGLRVLIRDLDCPVFISAKTRDAYVCESRRVGIANDEPRKRSDSLRDRTVEIDSNHSRDMLKTVEHYPWELKQRILSRLGHLSNEDVAEWLVDGFDGQARHLVLAHLSQRANNPYLAKITAETALRERAPLFPASTEVTLSFPKEPTAWIEVYSLQNRER